LKNSLANKFLIFKFLKTKEEFLGSVSNRLKVIPIFLKAVLVKQRFQTRYQLGRADFWRAVLQHLVLPFHRSDRQNKVRAKRNSSRTEAVFFGISSFLFSFVCFVCLLFWPVVDTIFASPLKLSCT